MKNHKIEMPQMDSPLPSFYGHTTDFICGFQAGVIWLALVAIRAGQSVRMTVVRTNVDLVSEVCESMNLSYRWEKTSPPSRSHVVLWAKKEALS